MSGRRGEKKRMSRTKTSVQRIRTKEETNKGATPLILLRGAGSFPLLLLASAGSHVCPKTSSLPGKRAGGRGGTKKKPEETVKGPSGQQSAHERTQKIPCFDTGKNWID